MDGDQLQAFTELYERHADAVYGYAARRCDGATAEEVVSQVFVVAWRRRQALPADPLPWLYGVARRVLAEQRRGEARRVRLQQRLRSDSAVAEQGEPAPELEDAVLSRALGELPESDRELLLLTYWEELSPAQVAQVASCSRATLAVRLHRARIRLRQRLEIAGVSTDAGDQLPMPKHAQACVSETESR